MKKISFNSQYLTKIRDTTTSLSTF